VREGRADIEIRIVESDRIRHRLIANHLPQVDQISLRSLRSRRRYTRLKNKPRRGAHSRGRLTQRCQIRRTHIQIPELDRLRVDDKVTELLGDLRAVGVELELLAVVARGGEVVVGGGIAEDLAQGGCGSGCCGGGGERRREC